MRKLILIIILLFTTNLNAQIIDAFNYPDGILRNNGKWKALSGTVDSIISVNNNQVRIYDPINSWRWGGIWYDSAVTNGNFAIIVKGLSSPNLYMGLISSPNGNGQGEGYWANYRRVSGAVDTMIIYLYNWGATRMAHVIREMVVGDTVGISYIDGIFKYYVRNGANSTSVEFNNTTYQATAKNFRLYTSNTTAGTVGYIFDDYMGNIITGGDNISPAINSYSCQNKFVGDSTYIKTTVSDNIALGKIRFIYDGSVLDSIVYNSPFPTTRTDSSKKITSLVPTTKNYSIVVFDTAGNSANASGAVEFYNATPPDETPPVINSISANNVAVNESTFININVSDNIALKKIRFTLQGALFDSIVYNSPFPTSAQVSSKKFAYSTPGSRVYAAVVWDTAGNITQSGNMNIHISDVSTKWVSAYLPSWELHMGPGTTSNYGQLPKDSIDWDAFTHVIMFAASANTNGTLSYGNLLPSRRKPFNIIAHSKGKPVILSIGGAGSSTWGDACNTPALRTTLVNSILAELDTSQYDGIDLDIEPFRNTGTINDTTRIGPFIRQLYDSLQTRRAFYNPNKKPFLLAAILPAWAGEWWAKHEHLFDQINIMTYDMAQSLGWGTDRAWHNNAIFCPQPPTGTNLYYTTIQTRWRDQMFNRGAVDRSKYGIGIDYNGTRYVGGVSTTGKGIYQPMLHSWITAPTFTWDYDFDAMYLAYIDTANTTKKYDATHKGAYISIYTDDGIATNETMVSWTDSIQQRDIFKFMQDSSINGAILWNIGEAYLPPSVTKVPRDWMLKITKKVAKDFGYLAGGAIIYPSTPNLVYPLNGSTGLPINTTIRWGRVAGAIDYDVIVTSGGSTIAHLINYTDSSYQLSLTTGAQYVWQARARNANGYSNWSPQWLFTTQPPQLTIPNPPSLISPSNNANNLYLPITLVWQNITSDSIIQSHLQLSKNSDFNIIEIDNQNAINNYQLAFLTLGTKYFWRVKERNIIEWSGWSQVYNFTTIYDTASPMPTVVGYNYQPMSYRNDMNKTTHEIPPYIVIQKHAPLPTVDNATTLVTGQGFYTREGYIQFNSDSARASYKSDISFKSDSLIGVDKKGIAYKNKSNIFLAPQTFGFEQKEVTVYPPEFICGQGGDRIEYDHTELYVYPFKIINNRKWYLHYQEWNRSGEEYCENELKTRWTWSRVDYADGYKVFVFSENRGWDYNYFRETTDTTIVDSVAGQWTLSGWNPFIPPADSMYVFGNAVEIDGNILVKDTIKVGVDKRGVISSPSGLFRLGHQSGFGAIDYDTLSYIHPSGSVLRSSNLLFHNTIIGNNIFSPPQIFTSNRRVTGALFVHNYRDGNNRPVIQSTTSHASLMVDRRGLEWYHSTDNIQAARFAHKIQNTGAGVTAGGLWSYAETDTSSTTNYRASLMYGVSGQAIHQNNSIFDGTMRGLMSRISFLNQARGARNADVIYGDVEASLDTVTENFSWLNIGTGESQLRFTSANNFGIRYTGTLPSTFGGNISSANLSSTNLTLSGLATVDTIIGMTTSGGSLNLISTSHATKGNIVFRDANYLDYYGTSANPPYIRTFNINTLGNWFGVGGVQFWGRDGAGNYQMMGGLQVNVQDTTRTSSDGYLVFPFRVDNQTNWTGLRVWGNGSKAINEINPNVLTSTNIGVEGSRIRTTLYGNDRGTRLDFMSRDGEGSIVNALSIDSSQRVGIGTTTPTGVLHLRAGTATAGTAPLKFTAGTNLTTPEPGAVEYDGRKFYATSVGTRRSVAMTGGVAVSSTTVSNTTTETTVYEKTILANSMSVGDVIVPRILGHYSTANATDQYTLRFKIGGTTVLTIVSTAASVSNVPIDAEIINTVRSLGTTGEVMVFADAKLNNVGRSIANTSTNTVNTTTANTLTVTIQWSASNANNSVTITQGYTRFY